MGIMPMVMVVNPKSAAASYPLAEFTATDVPGICSELLDMLTDSRLLRAGGSGIVAYANIIIHGITYSLMLADHAQRLGYRNSTPVPNWAGVVILEVPKGGDAAGEELAYA